MEVKSRDYTAAAQTRGKSPWYIMLWEIPTVDNEPLVSLNPGMRIGPQLTEEPTIHEGVSRADARARSLQMIDAIRLLDAKRMMSAYPHQLSGGHLKGSEDRDVPRVRAGPAWISLSAHTHTATGTFSYHLV